MSLNFFLFLSENNFYLLFVSILYFILKKGPMVNKKQAETSAAEVCLRSLGYLQSISPESYVVQPYRGGRVIYGNLKPKSAPSLMSDIQQVFCFSKIVFRARVVDQGRCVSIICDIPK